jgi:hypothetical protein
MESTSMLGLAPAKHLRAKIALWESLQTPVTIRIMEAQTSTDPILWTSVSAKPVRQATLGSALPQVAADATNVCTANGAALARFPAANAMQPNSIFNTAIAELELVYIQIPAK